MRMSDWSSDVCSSDLFSLLSMNLWPQWMVKNMAFMDMKHPKLPGLRLTSLIFLREMIIQLFIVSILTRLECYLKVKDSKRSEKRRVGKESVSTDRYRGWTYK